MSTTFIGMSTLDNSSRKSIENSIREFLSSVGIDLNEEEESCADNEDIEKKDAIESLVRENWKLNLQINSLLSQITQLKKEVNELKEAFQLHIANHMSEKIEIKKRKISGDRNYIKDYKEKNCDNLEDK